MRSRKLRKAVLFLCVPAVSYASSLQNFESLPLQGVPTACLNAYNTQIPVCKPDDFNKSCTPACIKALESIGAQIQQSCSSYSRGSSSLIDIVKNGGILPALCPTLAKPQTNPAPGTTNNNSADSTTTQPPSSPPSTTQPPSSTPPSTTTPSSTSEVKSTSTAAGGNKDEDKDEDKDKDKDKDKDEDKDKDKNENTSTKDSETSTKESSSETKTAGTTSSETSSEVSSETATKTAQDKITTTSAATTSPTNNKTRTSTTAKPTATSDSTDRPTSNGGGGSPFDSDPSSSDAKRLAYGGWGLLAVFVGSAWTLVS